MLLQVFDVSYLHRVLQAFPVNKDHLAQEVFEDQKAVKVSRESQPLAHAPLQRERRESQAVMEGKAHRGHQACLAPEENQVTKDKME